MKNRAAQQLGKLNYRKNKDNWFERASNGGKKSWEGTTKKERSEEMKRRAQIRLSNKNK